MNRNLINLALALILVPATVAMVLKRLPDTPASVLAFPKPTHRVAMAVDEAMKAELVTVSKGEYDLMAAQSYSLPKGKIPIFGKSDIPEDYEAFWMNWAGPSTAPIPTHLSIMQFDGTTRDGRKVHVIIQDDPLGEGSLVDCQGDEALAKALAPRIAECLAHPKHKHESPEDRAALMAFFGSKPPPAKAPGGTVDPAVQRASGTVGEDSNP